MNKKLNKLLLNLVDYTSLSLFFGCIQQGLLLVCSGRKLLNLSAEAGEEVYSPINRSFLQIKLGINIVYYCKIIIYPF